MKNIFLIAASFLAGIAFRHGIQIDKDRNRSAHATLATKVKERPFAPEQIPNPVFLALPELAPARPATTWTFVPALGRHIEHDRTVSVMRSIGGG